MYIIYKIEKQYNGFKCFLGNWYTVAKGIKSTPHQDKQAACWCCVSAGVKVVADAIRRD